MSQKLSASRKICRSEEKRLAKHPAWKGSHLFDQKEALLVNQEPFSFLLGLSNQENLFAVAWVKEDGMIENSNFGYNPQTKTWFYRNGSPHECKYFEDLLSSMFHCLKEDLKPYVDNTKI